MADGSFRTMYADILGKYNHCDGIVIDTRFNGGGRMHEDIEILFSGEKYLTQVVRGKEACDMPSRRWNKASIMITCEANYSNAHGTPWVYKHRGIGKVVGMPVPGTMTSVSWERLQDPSLVFGIPVVGYRKADGTYLENEWNSMSAAERNEFAQLSQPAIEQEAPIHHQPHDDVDVVYHDPEVRIHNTSNDISQNDDDVQIVGVEEVTLADGSTATMAQANVDGHDVYMVDVDQDGVFDVAAMDVNGNGQLDDNEIIDVSSQGVTMNGTASTVSNDGMSGMDDGMMVDASMSGVDGMMPDYTNDVDGDILV
jgi:hypothetical protein